jgi:DNA-binding winged helix-turn-helix (wHTH) protein
MLTDRVSFGPYTIDPKTGELRREGVSVPLQDLPFRLLSALLERPGELVTRSELTERVWGSDTYVDSTAGLNTAVAKLRDALGDNADQPLYIETVPKRGYRFIGAVVVTVETPLVGADQRVGPTRVAVGTRADTWVRPYMSRRRPSV